MLPNSAASKLRPTPPNSANRASPSANDAVVMTPIAASAPISAATRDPVDHQRRGDAPDAGAEQEVHAEQRAGGEAAEDRVRQAVADVAHARAARRNTPTSPHSAPGERRDRDPVAEELEVVRARAGLPHRRSAGRCEDRRRVPECRRRRGMPACSRMSMRAPKVRSSTSGVSTCCRRPSADDPVEADEAGQVAAMPLRSWVVSTMASPSR